MKARAQILLWGAQRVSAMVLAFCVVIHLATVVYAVRSGLTAAEILARTQGNALWLAFYLLFVVAVSVHAPIGLRTLLSETTGWRGHSLDFSVLITGILLALWGARAIWAVYG